MSYNFKQLGGPGLDEAFVEWLIENCRAERIKRFGRLHDYYANPASEPKNSALFNERSSGYVQAQEQGLPSRITGVSSAGIEGGSRKEVVIENDIGWRIDSMNDFLFGCGVRFVSRCSDSAKAREIERIIREVFEANGDGALLMSLGLLGSVQGFTDIIVRTEDLLRNSRGRDPHKLISLDLASAQNSLPLLNENDCRLLDYYIQHFPMQVNRCEKSSALSRLAGKKAGRKSIMVTEVFGSLAIQRYHDGELISRLENRLGEVPVVHIQNITRPHSYEGASDVEPLIPLQDELNTRLSDRAARITMQSFKLYLAKGIENPGDCELKPGRVWYTWNDEAKIEEFGGDSACPGEESHISELREAMDKISGVTPLAAGVIRSKIGNLTSAVALKMTLMGMLSKNERRRQSYGAGLKQVCRLILKACDMAGIIGLSEEDYAVEVVFADPLPENTTEKLNEALLKKEVGLPEEEVFRELGVRY